MNKKKIVIVGVSLVAVLAVLISGFFFYKKHFSPKAEITTPEPVEKDHFTINDELAGISFKIGKKFTRIAPGELQRENPNFIYGFRREEDPAVACFISQTKRPQGGQVILGELRDRLFEEIKKDHPEAQLAEAKIITIGEDNQGVWLKINYPGTGSDKHAYTQWEVAGITEERATFAFCRCPQAVLELYQADWELFLKSVRIFPQL